MLEIKHPKGFDSLYATHYVEYKTQIKHKKKIPNKPNYKSSEQTNKTQSYAKSHSRTILIFSIQQIKLADVNVISVKNLKQNAK